MDAADGCLEASLGPVWEARLGHSSSGSHVHKAVEMKAVLRTYSRLGGRSSRGHCWRGPRKPRGSHKGRRARLLKRGRRVPPWVQTAHPAPPAFSHVNAPRSTEWPHAVSVALPLSVVTNIPGMTHSEQIRTNFLYVSKGSVYLYPSRQSPLDFFLLENN